MRGPKIALVAILGIVFVSVGDRFLPDPAGKASTQTRTAFTGFLSGLFPEGDGLQPHERTEEAVDDFERRQNVE